MTCLSCGAELEDGIIVCPYCGTENIDRANKEHREAIGAIYEKIGDKEHLENVVAKKANRIVGKLGIVVVVMVTIAILLAYIISRVISGSALERQEKHLEKLESYYRAGQYQQVADYYNKLDDRSDSYAKYKQTAEVMRWREYAYAYIGEELDNFNYLRDLEYEEFRESIAENLTFELNNIFLALYQLDKMEQDGYRYNEQVAVETVREEIIKDFKKCYLITDEEIALAVPLQEDVDLDRMVYMELSQKLTDRIWENRQEDIQKVIDGLYN